MSELKLCPFCGGELYYTTVTDNPFSYDTYSAGHCSKCHATGPFVVESYLEDEAKPTCDYMKAAAKEKWQTRPIEDELRKRIAELESALINARELIGMTPQPAFPAWVPVSERLPECEKDVLVFWGKALDGSKVDWFGTAWRNDSDDGKWCTDPIVPTHWMPLPQPPEVQESEATSCEFCGSNKSDRRMNSIVCTSCGRKIGNIAPPEVQQ